MISRWSQSTSRNVRDASSFLRNPVTRNAYQTSRHGWGDAAIAPLSSIDYYERVVSFFKAYPDARTPSSNAVPDFYRLFMVPGMGHCAGGPGPTSFGNDSPGPDAEHDIVTALEIWVEKGIAPEHLIGTGRMPGPEKKKMTRPLCPYPQVARYRGAGDAADAANFTCEVPASPR